ncbi:MAG TPA: hypothetical protein VHH73_20230 [Verrucomicrobiae bacterium]|nr:hypothetical protein [Verrucomicrobiae bacterium]
MPPPNFNTPVPFPEEHWHYRRAAMRAKEVEPLRRLVNALVDELLQRDAYLIQLGHQPPKVYDLQEILMYVQGTSLRLPDDGCDGP